MTAQDNVIQMQREGYNMGENGNLPAAGLDWSNQKLIETLRKTVAQGSTEEEFVLFSEFCKSQGLNPFKKEAWFIKAGGRLQIMVGLAGYLQIANRHPQFDGMEVEVIEDNNRPVKAICKVFRKDRKYPSTGLALMREYGKSTPIWQQMPTVMLTKVAKSIALREAFPQELGGTYTDDELPEGNTTVIVQKDGPRIELKPADEIEQREEYLYDISELPADKMPAAKKLLADAHADYDESRGMYISAKAIAKLKNYLAEPDPV